jgi:hypothetical protein
MLLHLPRIPRHQQGPRVKNEPRLRDMARKLYVSRFLSAWRTRVLFNFPDFCYTSLEGVGVMFAASLVPDEFYWARPRKHSNGRLTIVQV